MTAQEARLDLYALAALLDRSYDYVVRHWRRMVDEEGLPMPFTGRNGRKPRWSRKAVERWRDGEAPPAPAASAPITAPRPAAAVANDPAPVRRKGASALVAAAGG
jgi:hypothetical protein